ncbi:MAG: HD domain-containing protein [Holophagaceae bacterium]|nr:HD domain-containing protein [Holophagaceae bacterium]
MKIRRNLSGENNDGLPQENRTWKILVVDDEPGILVATKNNLINFEYLGHGLEFVEAGSAEEARKKIIEHPDVAVAIIDVIMESDDAGLKLVEYIRKDLDNDEIRLIIRTGQPGANPEKSIIDKYDINDYREKMELSAQKLSATLRFSLKDYNQIMTIEANKNVLKHILNVTPHLYELKVDYLEDYFAWMLNQLVYVCQIAHTGMISTIDGLLATTEGKEAKIQASIGDFKHISFSQERRSEIIEICKKITLEGCKPLGLRSGSLVIPLISANKPLGFVYLESTDGINKNGLEFTQILANQCVAGLDNYMLFSRLEKSYDNSIDMLALVAEYKDMAVGGHILRTQELTKRLSLALGLGHALSESYAKASRLHDIGKVGIPDAILSKPSQLTPEEFKIIATHSIIGDQILRNQPALEIARSVARSHHERWDGKGYPDGLLGSDIPLEARIAAIVDVFDALASPRPYKKSWPLEDVIAEIEGCSGTQFDPKIVNIFSKIYRSGDLDDLAQKYEMLNK